MISRKRKIFLVSAVVVVTACLLLSGCGNNSSQQEQQSPPNNQSTSNQQQSQTEPKPEDKAGNDLHQRAEKIADAVTQKLDDVKDSRVILSEKMAYVSVSIDAMADAAQSTRLKEEISQVVKNTDKDIETVYVMEDADTITRMKEMADEIADGRPVSGFLEELETMFARVTPSPQGT